MAGPSDEREAGDSAAWFALAVVGAFVFVLGVWIPAFAFAPGAYRGYVQMAVAALGGVLFILGLSRGFDARAREKRGGRRAARSPARSGAGSLESVPSFEVYDPRRLPPPRPDSAGPTDEPPRDHL